jgi:RNA-directed DNA polymerase
MMNGPEKSDPAIVAEKSVNNAEQSAAEPVEQRAGTKGNAGQQSTHRTQSRTNVSQALERIRKAARERKKERFTALFHHITVELLEEAFYALAQNAAPGVDRRTWKDYEADLEHNIEDLHGRVQSGAYRALPSRRVYIPKPDGQQRPLAVAALEDKIVQRAVVVLLNAIYEEDFLGFSYGFRPGRGAHDALDALCVGIHGRKVSFIVDADIRSFFDTISQQWLIRFLEHRIGDRRIIRLIQKWLKAGIVEDGVVAVSDRGTGQGSVISPLLANIYLHYALDLWAARWRRRTPAGDMIIVRYADDFIVGFQHESDAQRFLNEMRERLREFALSLHPEKTRLIEFGRFAAKRRKRRGLGKASPSSAARLVREDSRSNGKPAPTACGRSCRKSSRRCDGACTSQSPSREGGWSGLSAAISTITPCQPIVRHWRCSGIMSLIFGGARCGVAVRRIG